MHSPNENDIEISFTVLRQMCETNLKGTHSTRPLWHIETCPTPADDKVGEPPLVCHVSAGGFTPSFNFHTSMTCEQLMTSLLLKLGWYMPPTAGVNVGI